MADLIGRRKIVSIVALLGLAILTACGSSAKSSSATASSFPTTHSPAPAKSTSAPSQKIPVLNPGQSLTFTVNSQDANNERTSVTWTMGPKVTQATTTSFGKVQKGYEVVVFDLTIRNNGPHAIQTDPTMQSYLIWGGVNGRTDNTLAGTAALVTDGEFGQNGTDLSLQSGLQPGHFVTGYIAWQVPTTLGAVALVSDQNQVTGNAKPDVIINYDRLTAQQIGGAS